MKSKRVNGALRSRTVWFNAVSAVLLMALPEIKDALPALQEYMPPEIYRWLIIGVVIGNIWLRAITTQTLEDKS